VSKNGLKRLLVVEDDKPIADLLKHHFTAAGYTVTATADGDEALILIQEIKPDLVILDWMIEGTSGIEVCRRVRRSPATAKLPIIMVTARGHEEDRVRGLDTGADDFVAKPFSPKELVSRANALLRRSKPDLLAQHLGYAGIEMDTAAHRVRRNGKLIDLGPTEYRLLYHFLRNPERVFSRQQLLEAVWPHNEEIEQRTVDVLVRRLRLALGEQSNVLRTVRAEGYSLDAASASE
jgi:two-component system phosphate regulon response regulator PhoB